MKRTALVVTLVGFLLSCIFVGYAYAGSCVIDFSVYGPEFPTGPQKSQDEVLEDCVWHTNAYLDY